MNLARADAGEMNRPVQGASRAVCVRPAFDYEDSQYRIGQFDACRILYRDIGLWFPGACCRGVARHCRVCCPGQKMSDAGQTQENGCQGMAQGFRIGLWMDVSKENCGHLW